MSQAKESRKIGKDKSYFAVMKHTNKKLYRFCRMYGLSLSDGYSKYMESTEKTFNEIYKQYIEKFDNENNFSRWLIAKGHYKTVQCGWDLSRTVCMTREQIPTWDYAKKCKKILKQLKETK